jgi:uncharacterized protein
MLITIGPLASPQSRVYNGTMSVHPVGRAADTVSKLLTRSWKLPPRRNRVTIEAKVPVPMKDGTELLADHYIPVIGRQAPTVLVRCPYGRGFPFSLGTAQLVAERGYHVLLQSCRGTFGSGGDFEPMRDEITDGQDTVSWLREQSWFNGRLATFGLSYLGFVQWALAMDPPPELEAAVVQVGPHDFSRSAYHNGVFDIYNFLEWSDMMAHQEELRGVRGFLHTATAERRLRPVLDGMPVITSARTFLGSGAPWFESWLEHPGTGDEFWSPLQCGAALDRIGVPTLLVGGWHDLFIEQTLEQYATLTGREVPARLLVGPWAHLDVARAGVVAAESLLWLDRHLGDHGAPAGKSSVRVFVGGAGQWRDLSAWPPPGTREQSWYLAGDMTLTKPDTAPWADTVPGSDAPAGAASFRYDPADPTPSVGGAVMSSRAGTRDNRPVEQRPDVLVYTSAELTEPVEVIGEVTAELMVTRDNPHADLFVRLCDVDPRGVSRNVCDGITRLTDATALDATVTVSLIGAAHRFRPGHRIRLQVAGGAHPRFLRNPGTGEVDAPPMRLKATSYRIGSASVLRLPVAAAEPSGSAGR